MRTVAILLALSLAAASSPVGAGDRYPGCEPYPVGPNSPTGIVGCHVYGEGTASMWGGPGAARNDCVWPWKGCQTIAVQSLDTGLVIIVTPSMYCDCFVGRTGPNGETERLIDLAPSMVKALGLDPALGLWRVRVTPVSDTTGQPLSDTAMARP